MNKDDAIVAFFRFLRTLWGILVRPYETYRTIIASGSNWELMYIGLFMSAYFVFAVLVKVAAFRPYVLTRQFIPLAGASFAGWWLAVELLWRLGMYVGGKGTRWGVARAWAYSLIPTVMWFWLTSVLYIVLPPPRTTQWSGIAFSIVYLVICTVLFFWKGILGYLTLRFGLRLDLPRILMVVCVTVPVLALYSVLMYRFGIFKVPFL